MGELTIFSLLLISLSTIYAQRYGPNSEYRLSSSLYDYNPFDKMDLRTTGSRQARRIVLPDDKGRRSRYQEEFDDYDDDDQSYTVGTRIQVQHPTPLKYKKYVNDEPNIVTSFTKYNIAHENVPQKLNKRKPERKPERKPLFKSTRDFDSESDETYSIEKEQENIKVDYKRPKIVYPREFEEVASKKQIAQYFEDQQKLLDEVIQLRLLNDPNPGAKAKYQQFLKAKDDERIEKEYEDELKRKPFALFRPNIEPKRKLLRKNQPKITNIHPPPLPPPRTSSSAYNNGFRKSVPHSMTFHVDV